MPRLSRLTHLEMDVRFGEEDTQVSSWDPLELVSCTTSLRSLQYYGVSQDSVAAPVLSLQGAFSNLRLLYSLSLCHEESAQYLIPLLDGINPPQLTSLELAPDSVSLPLMHSIRRFGQLRDLCFWGGSASVASLLQLFSLTSLTGIRLGV